jgi:hypothetical protein
MKGAMGLYRVVNPSRIKFTFSNQRGKSALD